MTYKLKEKKVRPLKRIKFRNLSSRVPLDVIEAHIDQMAEEEEVMARYESGQEVG